MIEDEASDAYWIKDPFTWESKILLFIITEFIGKFFLWLLFRVANLLFGNLGSAEYEIFGFPRGEF